MEPIGVTLLASGAGHGIAFYVLAALTVAAAILMVLQKNPVASALWLVLCFIGMAGLFVIMEAFFIAVVQVLVYAGAIMVLFLFVIMLLDLREGEGEIKLPRMPAVGLAAAALFLVAMIAVISASKPFFAMPMVELIAQTSALAADPALRGSGSVGAVGFPLFSEWLLPFEVTSVLLLAAIVGAVALTKKAL